MFFYGFIPSTCVCFLFLLFSQLNCTNIFLGYGFFMAVRRKKSGFFGGFTTCFMILEASFLLLHCTFSRYHDTNFFSFRGQQGKKHDRRAGGQREETMNKDIDVLLINATQTFCILQKHGFLLFAFCAQNYRVINICGVFAVVSVSGCTQAFPSLRSDP